MSHDKIAATFDEWAKSGRGAGLEKGHGDAVRQVIAQMDIRAGNQMLDLGCGTGWATRMLGSAAPGAGAVGVDVSGDMIAKADELHDWTSRARYEKGSFEALGFNDGKFDKAFSMEALYYAVDLDKSLSEILRVLKSGGTADIIIDHFKESPHTESWTESIGLSTHYMGEEEWKAAFEKAGFTKVQLTRVIDSRGPGDEADFEANVHEADWKTHVELHEAGSLWIHALKA